MRGCEGYLQGGLIVSIPILGPGRAPGPTFVVTQAALYDRRAAGQLASSGYKFRAVVYRRECFRQGIAPKSGSVLLRRVEQILFDFRTQDWYTRRDRAYNKYLILLDFCVSRGNPSLSASFPRTSKIPSRVVASPSGWRLE